MNQFKLALGLKIRLTFYIFLGNKTEEVYNDLKIGFCLVGNLVFMNLACTRKWGEGWGVEVYHVFADFIVFKHWIYYLFLRVVGVWGQRFGHFF